MAKNKPTKKAPKKAAKKAAPKKAAKSSAKKSTKKSAKKVVQRRKPSRYNAKARAAVRRLRGPADSRPLSKRDQKRALKIRKQTGFFDSQGRRIKQRDARNHLASGRNLYIRHLGNHWGVAEGAGH